MKTTEKPKGRVLILSQYYPPDVVGSGTRTHHIVKELLRRNYNVTLLTGVPHYPEGNSKAWHNRSFHTITKHDQLTEIRLWMPPARHSKFLGRMVNYLHYCVATLFFMPCIRNVDVIMAMAPNFFVYPVGLLYKMFKRVPLVANVDDLWPEALEDLGVITSPRLLRFLKRIRNQMLRMADRITPISNTITKYLIGNGISPDMFTTIDVGFDMDRLVQLPSKIERPHQDDAFRIIYAGALSPSYDFKLILKLAAIAISKGKNWTFIIKGSGEQEEYIRSQIKSKKLTNVELWQKHLELQEYAEFMSSAKLFILPMKDNFISSTALPSKLFDFMAFERPVLLLGRGAPAQLVRESSCGSALLQSQIDDAFSFIEKVENDRDYAIALGRNGKVYLEANLSLDSIGEKLESVLSSVLG